LIETLMAMLVIGIFLTSQYAATSRVWGLLRASLESNAASRVLNGRAEQIRAATWTQVTSSDFFATSILSVKADSGGDLGALVETIDVIAFPTPATASPALQITRNNDTAAVTLVGAGDGTMTTQPSIRINLTANWTAKGGMARTRQLTMVLSYGGVTGRH